jgi:hypothetical protein
LEISAKDNTDAGTSLSDEKVTDGEVFWAVARQRSWSSRAALRRERMRSGMTQGSPARGIYRP